MKKFIYLFLVTSIAITTIGCTPEKEEKQNKEDSSKSMELSVPDDWKKPIEDNYNSMPESEYTPEFSEYIPAEGDTGEDGAEWELPKWNDDDGVSGEIEAIK